MGSACEAQGVAGHGHSPIPALPQLCGVLAWKSYKNPQSPSTSLLVGGLSHGSSDFQTFHFN